ncbi:MAG: ABC transporter ATP-binding protein [Desulfocapsaceae bacterium]|jgi:simple sugar transport system ATP-binding protein|nr:ABC transporter ATP-binding protein [Desulfocapsaceae bacterium]
MTEALVSLRGISKQFGTVSANLDIDFDIHRGRVHALLGENGAGKSTLMSILAGRYRADSGTITINGTSVSFSSPASALGHGIGMVYQRFMLIESMTVAENLLLSAHRRIGRKNVALTIQETAQQYGLDIDPHKYIFELSMGERQRVEIIKLLLLDAQVLIFDEPTAVLTPPEVAAFFSVIDTLRNAGKGIVFITHKLEEVLKLADDISVMRKGRLIVSTQADREQLSRRRLAQLMVGRDVVLQVVKEPVEPGDTVLLLENLSGNGSLGSVSFDDISFEVRRGEIFSIIGVAGNGQSALVEAITGLGPAHSGQLSFCGRTYTPRQWLNSSKDTIAYVPEDRYHTGSVGSMSIGENSGLTRLSAYQNGIGGMFLDRKQMLNDCAAAIKTFNIKAESPDDTADSLSGGNLQKVILARELSRKPQLFIAEQPTQGLDISATEDIWKALLECRKEAAVLLVTGDLKEVLSLSDRIGVIFNGRILEIIDAHDADAVGRVGLLMAGVSS